MPTQHAVLGPSSAHRWIECPGSVELSKTVPRPPESPHAAEGTFAHTYAELLARDLILKEDVREDLRDLLEKIRGAYGSDADDRAEEMKDSAIGYAEFLESLIQEYADEGPMLLLERRVSPAVPGVWGTADAVIVTPDRVIVVDLKYGKGVRVDAERNPQLSLYGLGAVLDYGDLLGDPEDVSVIVYQPRIGNVSRWDTTPGELMEWRDVTVAPAAEKAISGTPEFHPSEDACRWCPALGVCRARMEATVREDFGDDRDPASLTAEDFVDLLPKLPGIRRWAEAVEAAALDLTYSQGEELPGYKVVRSGGKRVISDKDAALDLLVKAGISREDIVRQDLVTLSKLDKAAGGAKKLSGILGELMSRTEGRPAIVPEDDPRAPVDRNVSAAEDFA